MNQEKKQLIQNAADTVISYIDQLPTGQVIPSDWKAPDEFTYEKNIINGIPIECLTPKEKKTDRVVFQTHGGGYVVGLCDPFRDGAVQYSNMAGGAKVYSVDYRVAPTNKYPAGLEDAIAAYQWILDQGNDPQKMIFVGDSAGGNLILALTLYLKDHKMPLPKAVIAISPWTNAACDFESVSFNAYQDVVLGKNGLKMGDQVEHPCYFLGADVKNPYASPVYGDFSGFPDLLIQVGSNEILLDDALHTAKAAKEAGVHVRQTTYPEMSHDFQLLFPMLEESKMAWEEMKDFVEEALR